LPTLIFDAEAVAHLGHQKEGACGRGSLWPILLAVC